MVVYISEVCDAPADSFKGMRVFFSCWLSPNSFLFFCSAVLLCVKLHIVCVCGLVLR